MQKLTLTTANQQTDQRQIRTAVEAGVWRSISGWDKEIKICAEFSSSEQKPFKGKNSEASFHHPSYSLNV